MDKLALLDSVWDVIRTGDVNLACEQSDVNQMFGEVRAAVEEELHREVFDDITSPDTGFFAPEHSSWKDMLQYGNSNEDYHAVLNEYQEEELDYLWSASHIAEEVTEEQLERRLYSALTNLKAIQMIEKQAPETRACYRMMKDHFMAQIKGIYNLLCE